MIYIIQFYQVNCVKSFDSRPEVKNMLQNQSVVSTHGVNADPLSIL